MDVAAQLMEHLAERRRLESRLKELGENIRQDLDRLDGEEVIIEAEPASWFSTHSDHPKPNLAERMGTFRFSLRLFMQLSGSDGAWFIDTNNIVNISLANKE